MPQRRCSLETGHRHKIARCTLHPALLLRTQHRDLRSHPVAVSELPTPGSSGGLTPVTLAVLTQAVTASEETH